jgi:hypothetical protein
VGDTRERRDVERLHERAVHRTRLRNERRLRSSMARNIRSRLRGARVQWVQAVSRRLEFEMADAT